MGNAATEYLVDEATEALCDLLPPDPVLARQVAARVAERVGACRPWHPVRLSHVDAVVAACAGIGGVLVTRMASATGEPPHRNLHVELVETTLGPDDPLQIRFVSHRTRLCKADLDRIVLDSDGTPVHAVRQTGIGQAVTKEPITRTIRVPLPWGLPPGQYTYRSTVFSDCGGDIFAAPSPDLTFEIVRTDS